MQLCGFWKNFESAMNTSRMMGFSEGSYLCLISWLVVNRVCAETAGSHLEVSSPLHNPPAIQLLHTYLIPQATPAEELEHPIEGSDNGRRIYGVSKVREVSDDNLGGTHSSGNIHTNQDGSEDPTQVGEHLHYNQGSNAPSDSEDGGEIRPATTANESSVRSTPIPDTIPDEYKGHLYYTKENITTICSGPSLPAKCTAFCQVIVSDGKCVEEPICVYKTLISLSDPGHLSDRIDLLSKINTPRDLSSIRSREIFHLIEIEKLHIDELVLDIIKAYEKLMNDKTDDPNREFTVPSSIASTDEISVTTIKEETSSVRNMSAEDCGGSCERFDEWRGQCVKQPVCFFKAFLQTVVTDSTRFLLISTKIDDYDDGFSISKALIARLEREKKRWDILHSSIRAAYDTVVNIIKDNSDLYSEYEIFLPLQGGDLGSGFDGVFGGPPGGFGAVGFSSGFGGGGGLAHGIQPRCSGVCASPDTNGDCRVDVGCFRGVLNLV